MSVSTIMGVPVANIAKINGISIANISKWNGEDIVTDVGSDFITEWVIPVGSLSVTLPLSNGNGSTFNCTVDWGDGSALSAITAHDDADRIHTYASAGTYQIKIRGTCEGWSFNNTGDCLKITKVVNFGYGSRFTGFKYLADGFFGCSNLISIGSQYIKPSGAGVDSFERTFSYCSSLTSVPKELLKYHVNAISFFSTFYNCYSLAIRDDIFYSNGEQSTRFFNKSINFQGCFYRTSFTGVQGTAPDLWNCNYGTGSLVSVNCFKGAGNSVTSISNYASIPIYW